MEPAFTPFSIIMLIGAAHGFFLAFVLANNRDSRGSGHFFLALFTLAFATDLAHEFLYQSRYLLNLMVIAFVDPIVNLLYGPSFYLYACILTRRITYRAVSKILLHFLPFLIAVVVCLALPALTAEQFSSLYYLDAEATSSDEALVQRVISHIAFASVLSLGLYIVFSIKLLNFHGRLIRQHFSSIEKVTLNWLKALLLALSVLYFTLILDGFFAERFGLHENLNRLLYLLIVIVIYTMGYMGLRQPAIFTTQHSQSLPVQPFKNNRETSEPISSEKMHSLKGTKYEKSALNSTMSAALKDELQEFMKERKPFLESQLTLGQLAKQLNISPNYLSQVINEQLNMNFFDFINEHRIDEAKTLLSQTDKKNVSIIDIANDAGFNSKSAFYNAFKKHVGVTPSQFRKSVEVELTK